MLNMSDCLLMEDAPQSLVTCSIVLYENDIDEINLSINSFLEGCKGDLYLIDNSPKPIFDKLNFQNRVHYLFTGVNLGFGNAHNLAFSMASKNGSSYHLILNPDVSFNENVIPALEKLMEDHQDIGVVMPNIVYPNGCPQNLAKLLPTPFDLMIRRFIPINFIKDYFNSHYELKIYNKNLIYEIPSLSGCFLFCRSSILSRIGCFDVKYFMYMEDIDLVRRIGDFSKTIFFPAVTIIHHYKKGSYKNKKLLWYHVRSACYYFSKWGWFCDSVRKYRNLNAQAYFN